MNEDIGFVKPKDRKCNRRSSFFRRSFSSFNSDSPTGPGIRATLPVQQSSITRTQEDINSEYFNKLRKEKEDWKNLCDQKTKQEEELRDKCHQAASSADFLTAEDKKFLEDRPDYLAIGRLLDNVTEVVALKQQRIDSTMRKVDSFITHCEKISNEVAGEVIDYFMEDFDEFVDAAPAS